MTESVERSRDDVRNAIENAIKASAGEWNKFVDDNRAPVEDDKRRRPLAMKYMPSEWAKSYKPAKKKHRFYMGQKDYTWGRAVYVTGVRQPLSTAIYGRVGLVSWFEPDDPDDPWRVFDARDPTKAALYLDWLKLQPNYEKALLTVHTNHWLHGLRNDFREEFGIDVVMCEPDEHDDGWKYTHPRDTWLCVSDWSAGSPRWPQRRKLKRGFSKRFPDVRITVVPEEEFVVPPGDPKKPVRPPKEPPPHVPRLALSGKTPVAPNVGQAYWQRRIVTVPS